MNQSIILTVYNFHLSLVFVSLHGLSCGVEMYMQVRIQAPPPKEREKEREGRKEETAANSVKINSSMEINSSNFFFLIFRQYLGSLRSKHVQ